ncbi:MAG: ATPase [Lachnospiraceae bacterium]|nr:ATPase [Lachnospiraceae bacterium]
MLAEYNRLEKEIEKLNKKISQLPNGCLICAKNGSFIKWYVSENQKPVYLPKKHKNMAQKLAMKRYYTELLTTLKREQDAIYRYLDHHQDNSNNSASQLLSQPGYKELLSPLFMPTSHKLTEWMLEPYDKNPKHPEQLSIKTNSGNMVRSKSEAFIDMLLHANKIPFKYECALTLGSTVFYPDFTIMHPKTGEIFYWEHFGMMDDPVYAGKAYSKLQKFSKHGIIPSINLITTYETQEHPLDLDTVQKLIEQYFS